MVTQTNRMIIDHDTRASLSLDIIMIFLVLVVPTYI